MSSGVGKIAGLAGDERQITTGFRLRAADRDAPSQTALSRQANLARRLRTTVP